MLIPRHSTLRPAGALFEGDRQVADLLQCGHCRYTWKLQPGSGILRGFCFHCQKVLCGQAKCMASCTPAADAED